MYMPKPSADFVNAPEGTHPARCYRVIDLGTQQEEYQGQTKLHRKILVSWELHCEDRMEDGRPFTTGKKYTFSSHEKANLRRDLESWRGKKFEDSDFGPGGFHLSKLVGVPCLLNMTANESKGKTYVNVTAIMNVIKGMVVPPLVNEPVFLSLERDEWKPEVFNSLSDSLKEIIRKSPEYAECVPEAIQQSYTAPADRNPVDDEIPF